MNNRTGEQTNNLMMNDERIKYSGNTLMEKWLPWFLLAVILLFAAWLRFHLLGVALERDEGEYAYGGQLLLQGIPPYKLLYNMKLPGIYAAYAAVIAIFGASHTGIHLGLLVVNGFAALLIFLLVRELVGTVAGLTSALCFTVLSIGQPVQGVFANSEHFLIVPMLVGLLLVLRSRQEGDWQLFIGGLFLGLAFIVKQHGVFFIIGAGFFLIVEYLLRRPYGWRRLLGRLAIFSLGVLGPYLITCLLLAWAGVFDRFWFWTVEYAKSYTNQMSWSAALNNFSQRVRAIFFAAPLIWLLAGFGLPLAALHAGVRKNCHFILIFIGVSFLAICPGFYFRPHYFVLLLPAVSMLAGFTVFFLSDLKIWSNTVLGRAGVALLLVIICIGASLYGQREYLFFTTPKDIVRSIYWPNPFNESLAISRYIQENSEPTDSIGVIGSEPQINFYAQRHSATGYIYMYPLMENHNSALTMQKELIREIENSRPKFLVFVRINYSWLQRPDSQTLIYEWFQGYKKGYKRVGLVEIPDDFRRSTIYSWEPQVKWPPTSHYWIEILERRNEDEM